MKQLYLVFALLIVPVFQGIAQVQTDFEGGTTDDWTVEGDSDWFWEGGTGNPGGCLRINDDATGAMNRAFAPVKFLGDWSSATSSDTLKADIFLHQISGGYVSSNFVFRIIGPGGQQATGILNPTPTSDIWTTYKISLNSADWQLNSGTWSGLLANITTLMVTVEFISGDEFNRLDNISLSFSPIRDPIVPVICSNFEGGGYDEWAFQGTGSVSNLSSGGSPGRYIKINNSSSTAYAFAPTKFLGDWNLLDNHAADICFDLLVTNNTGALLLNDAFLRISGPGGVARIPMNTNVQNAFGQWYSFTFPIQASSWTMVSGTWALLIDQVTELRLCLEFTDGSETVGLDDFCISDQPPQSDFTVDHTYTFVGNPVQFTDISDVFPTGWAWTFGDAGTSSEKNPAHTYSQSGLFDVSLTVSNNFGSDMKQEPDYIEVAAIDQCLKFSDNFDAPTIHPAWSFHNGTWGIDAGTMRQTSNYYGSVLDACYAITGSPNWTDYSISADIKSTDNDRIGLVFNLQDFQNMYMFVWHLQTPERVLYKWVNGVSTILDSDNTGYSMDTWYHVKVGSYNGYITLTIDGQEIFNVQDNTFTSGKAGLYCWANQYTYWDNLLIECTINDILTLQNITVASGQSECYEATEVITVGGGGSTFIVENGGSATLGAGLRISCLPGTMVHSGGYLHGFISPTGPWCTSGSVIPQTIENIERTETIEQNTIATRHTDEKSFKIYPNPTTSTFTLELSGIGKEQLIHVEIYSMRGEKILSENFIGEPKHEFSLSNRPVGIYFILVIAGERIETGKIVKQ